MKDQAQEPNNDNSRLAEMRYIFLAALVGILAGTVGSFFHLIINHLVLWPQTLAHYVESYWLIIAAALITMCLTVFSVFVVQRVAPEAGGSGVQEIEGAMLGLRTVHWRRVLPVKFLVGITSLSSGLVLGREGPTIHIGSSIAAAITDFFKVSETDRRGMLGIGAAAGLSCAFNAPLAAILFITEETHKEFPYKFNTYMGVGVAALLATVMTEIIGGKAPDLSMSVLMPSLTLLPAFILLGCVLGALGVCLNAGIMKATGFAAMMQKRLPYIYPAIIGLIIGALFIVLPTSVTGGENIIMQLAQEKTGLLILLSLAIVRYFTMVGSYSAGTPGGLFAPMLALAMCTGLAFGTALESLMPGFDTMPLAFGIAAMGGLFAASIRSPIVGAALALELTGSYTMMIPLIATTLTANMVAQWLGGKPIYEELLDRVLKQNNIKIPAE